MKKVFYIFLSRPVTTIMFFFSVMVVGMFAIINLPVELSPHVEYPRLSVSVSWAGVSPEAVEAYITSPIEAELTTILGVSKISSRSSEGFSNITIDFHPDTDINFARIEINEKLTALKNELPAGISPPRISPYIPQDFQELQGFLTYSVSSNRSANEVRKYLIDNILLPLKSIDGVSNVEIRGGYDRLIEIIVNYEKAKALGITNEEINKAIDDAEIILYAGKIKNNNSFIYIKVKNQITEPAKINEQVIKILPNSQAIRIKDIANVNDDYKEPLSYYRINNKETVTLIISKEPGANTFKVKRDVEEKLNLLSKSFPSDYLLTKEIDKSEDMGRDLDSLYRDGVYSFIILFLVLLVIFRKLKYSIIIITSILFSLLFSFGLFYLFDLSLNIITIACFIIGLGFIVDNSIVVLDYLDKHYKGEGIKRLAVYIKEVYSPLFTSTFTIIAVFIPLIFLTGELRLYFMQFALGIGSTLTASFIVSIIVVPLVFLKSYKETGNRKNDGVLTNYIYIGYKKIITFAHRFKKLAFTFLILIIGLPVWLLPNRIEIPLISDIYNPVFDSEIYSDIKSYVNYALGGSLNLFFNHVSRGDIWKYGEETYIYIRLELPNGNRIDRINKLCNDLEIDIMQYKASFKNLIANVMDEETATLRVEFDDKQTNTAFPYMLKNYVTAYATRLGGVNSYVYGFGPGFSNAGGGSSSMFNVTVKGFNYEKVKSLAEDFKNIINRNPRVDNVDIDKSAFYWSPEVYEVIGKVNRDEMASSNISISELFSVISKNSGGNFSHSKFRINNDEVEYRVKFSNYNDVQLEDLQNTIITDSRKNKVKIGDLIHFDERKVLSTINREDQQYVRNVSFEFKGPYKYGQKFLESSLLSIRIPEGYSIKPAEFMFLFGDKDEIDILIVFIAAIIIIFMISSSLFESFKKPLLVIWAIPFALAGSVFLYWLGDFNIERGAYSGMLLLFGLSVSNSIMLVNYLFKKVPELNLQSVIEASGTRLRAIFTTSATTVFALIPFIIGNETTFWKNLSISIIGGIITSALYVVLVIPFLYSITIKRNKI